MNARVFGSEFLPLRTLRAATSSSTLAEDPPLSARALLHAIPYVVPYSANVDSVIEFASSNSALQRTGTHKVLGRGRPSQERTRSLARPRASAPRPVAELDS
jgi:hypothetical protein